MRQQKIIKDKTKTAPLVINERQIAAAAKIKPPEGSDSPVRAVYYVEVYDMEQAKVQLILHELNKQVTNLKGGAHYIIPVRHGKIGPDIMFEEEFLNVVKQICEIQDGQIVLKDGSRQVRILRETV
jgi:hypothetical protein